jgi:hypothetical protein
LILPTAAFVYPLNLSLVDQQNTFSSSSKDKKKAKNLSGSFTTLLKED